MKAIKQDKGIRTSLVVRWLRLRLPMPGVQFFNPLSGAEIPHAMDTHTHTKCKAEAIL